MCVLGSYVTLIFYIDTDGVRECSMVSAKSASSQE